MARSLFASCSVGHSWSSSTSGLPAANQAAEQHDIDNHGGTRTAKIRIADTVPDDDTDKAEKRDRYEFAVRQAVSGLSVLIDMPRQSGPEKTAIQNAITAVNAAHFTSGVLK